MTYLIDTNIFARTLIGDNPQMLEDCKALLSLVKTNKIQAAVPGIVLSELVWLLGSFYGLEKAQIIVCLRSIMQLSGLEIVDEYDYFSAVEMFGSSSAKYIDCLISSSAVQRQDMTIVSYDKDFDLLDVRRLEPAEVVAEQKKG